MLRASMSLCLLIDQNYFHTRLFLLKLLDYLNQLQFYYDFLV